MSVAGPLLRHRSRLVEAAGLRIGVTAAEVIIVMSIISLLTAIALPSIQRARDVSRRLECAARLRQVGVATHGFVASQGHFPAGLRPPPHKTSYMSWHATLLPWLEQEALFHVTLAAYDRDRTFFHNPPHVGLATVLPVLACPSDSRLREPQRVVFGYDVALTSYLGVAGTTSRTSDGMLYCHSAVRPSEVSDGLSSTLLVGERPPSADCRLGWWYGGTGQDGRGRADVMLGVRDFEFSADFVRCNYGAVGFLPGRVSDTCSVNTFWSLHFGGGHFLFADGSVRFLAYSAGGRLLALATRAKGEVVEGAD